MTSLLSSTPSSDAKRQGTQRLSVGFGLGVVLLLAATLRFDGLSEPSLWLDEILHLEMVRTAAAAMAEAPPSEWFGTLPRDRENGPLYYLGQLLALWLVGEPLEAAARLAPALAGLAAVAVLFFVGRRATQSATVGLVAAGLLAVSPLHVVYSREGRPYAAVMLAAALLLLCALDGRRWSRVLVYPLGLATACLGAVAAPVLGTAAALGGLSWLAACWWSWRRDGESLGRAGRSALATGRGHVALAAGLGLLLLPWLFPEVQGIRAVRGEEAREVDHGGDLAITTPWSEQALDRLLASLTVSGLDSGSATAASWVFVVLAVWGAVALLWRRLSAGSRRSGVWVAGFCLLPIGGWLVLLHLYDHWYNVRYTSAGLPAFLVLVAVGLVDPIERLLRVGERLQARFGRVSARERAWRPALTVVLAALVALQLATPGWRAARAEPWQKPDWRGNADLVAALRLPGEPLITRDPWAAVCLGHYLRRLDPDVEVHSADYELARAESLTSRYPRAWVAAAGHRRAAWLEGWLQGLDFVAARPGADFRLFFHSDFTALASAPGRGGALLAVVLAELGLEPGVDELAESELLLGPGWSSSERQPDGLTFRWAASARAELALAAPVDLAERPDEPRTLRLRLRPFPSQNLPPQQVTVTVNGEVVDTLELAPGWQQVTTAPYRSGRALDHVVFTFAWQQAPRDVDPSSGDRRRLAAAFDRVDMGSAASTPEAIPGGATSSGGESTK
ncbi:MAG: DUF6541 family protein [Acidobacteriota bacterium]